MSPKITVLMPVYNCKAYIEESVNSILNQTFRDFELIIIDDASQDGTLEIIKKINDNRICLIEKPVNKGYTDSLNLGLKLAKGKYIARMDGDDISLPDRFAKQSAFLDVNPHIILCGTQIQIIGSNKISNFPTEHEEIKVNSIIENSIAHPTVMMRNSIIKKYKLEYDPEMEPTEDYDLWTRMIFLGKLSNLSDSLLLYRKHDNQISNVKREQQLKNTDKVKSRMLQYLTPEIPLEFDLFQLKNSEIKIVSISQELKKRLIYMDKLILINKKKQVYNPKLFLSFIKSRKVYLFKLFFQRNNSSIMFFINILFFMPRFLLNVGLIHTMKISVKGLFKIPSKLIHSLK